MKYLFLTLGHNSSAIFHDEETGTIIGYEEERLNRIKSSSHFPSKAIEEITKHVDITRSRVCISHWFDTFSKDFLLNSNLPYSKYIDFISVSKLLMDYNCEFFSLIEEFTHHDAHAYSAVNFYETHQLDFENCTIIVADGYGNFGEVISHYEYSEKVINKIGKCVGLEKSLGLMYQFATDFVGMKMNQDEYKFLGYESHIQEVLTRTDIMSLDSEAREYAKHMYYAKGEPSASNDFQEIKRRWHEVFAMIHKDFCKRSGLFNSNESRIVIGFFTQTILEEFFALYIRQFKIENILLVGGLFYNVKLNNFISKKITGKICVMPIAGDQGAALGFYRKLTGLNLVTDFRIGKRKLVDNFVNYTHDDYEKLAEFIHNRNIANMIGKNMEFGPRALCSTSSLFMPDKIMVSINNKINNRNEVMPCAPVIRDVDMEFFFKKEDIDKVIGSLEYMIITLDLKNSFINAENLEKYGGIMHRHPTNHSHTARPQMITDEDSPIYKLLTIMSEKYNTKCLVNTSFNYHGTPIVFNQNDIEECMRNQDNSISKVFEWEQ
jgi:predicted NodU family carbamoyl transferase